MKVSIAKGTESSHAPHELDGLEFASIAPVHYFAERQIVGGGKSERLETASVQTHVRRSQAASCQSNRRLGTILSFVRIGSTQDGGRCDRTVTDIAFQHPAILRRDRLLEGEARHHVGVATVTLRSRTANQRQRRLQFVVVIAFRRS